MVSKGVILALYLRVSARFRSLCFLDIDKVIRAEMGRCKPETIIIQAGVNDIGPHRSEKLVTEYRCLIQRLRGFRKPVIVTDILPRIRASGEWH